MKINGKCNKCETLNISIVSNSLINYYKESFLGLFNKEVAKKYRADHYCKNCNLKMNYASLTSNEVFLSRWFPLFYVVCIYFLNIAVEGNSIFLLISAFVLAPFVYWLFFIKIN